MSNFGVHGSAEAKEDLEKGLFIVYDGEEVQKAGAGTRPDGVTTDSAKEGQMASFCLLGRVEVQAGEALTNGTKVESDANGRAVAQDTGSEAGIVRTKGVAPSGGDHGYADIVFIPHSD